MSLNENPVLVVGVFRSGTSLLCALLNQNPQIEMMFERDVWNFPRPLLESRFRGNWAERIEFYNQALSRHQLVSEEDYSGLETMRASVAVEQFLHDQVDCQILAWKTKGCALQIVSGAAVWFAFEYPIDNGR